MSCDNVNVMVQFSYWSTHVCSSDSGCSETGISREIVGDLPAVQGSSLPRSTSKERFRTLGVLFHLWPLLTHFLSLSAIVHGWWERCTWCCFFSLKQDGFSLIRSTFLNVMLRPTFVSQRIFGFTLKCHIMEDNCIANDI